MHVLILWFLFFLWVSAVDLSVLEYRHVNDSNGFQSKIKYSVNGKQCSSDTAHYESSHLDLHCLQRYLYWSAELEELNLQVLVTTATEDIFIYLFIFLFFFYFSYFFILFIFFFFFIKKNKTWHFMWIVYLADDSHEMPSIIFSEKYF